MKHFKLIVLTAILIGLFVAVSCKHQDQNSNGPVFKSVTIQLDSRSKNPGPDYLLSSGVQSAMISVVPESIYPVTSVTDLKESFDREMLDLSNNTVTVNVPLETEIRIAKTTYDSVYSEEQIMAATATILPGYLGISGPITIDANTTSKVVEVVMTEVVWTATYPPDGTTGGPASFLNSSYYPQVGFTYAMDPSTITTNVGTTTCSGTVQISKDDFSTCLSMFQQPTSVSGYGDRLFALVPTFNLDLVTTYKMRVKGGETGVKSAQGSELSVFYQGDYTMAEGVTTGTVTRIGGTFHHTGTTALTGSAYLHSGAFSSPGTTDDILTAARYNGPYAVTTDGTNLYMAETGTSVIRMVSLSTGLVTKIAGTGTPGWTLDNATGTSTQFNTPSGITTNGTYLFVADTNNHIIRSISLTPPYAVQTIAGTLAPGYADGDVGTSQFNYPYGITTDGDKYLYVADKDNHAIRRISLASPFTVTNVAGSASSGGSGSTNGTGTSALFNEPTSLTMSTNGSKLYVVDMSNNKIRQIDLTDNSVTDFSVTGVTLNAPRGITTDGTFLYVSNTGSYNILSIPVATGVGTSLMGLAGSDGCTAGSGTTARFTEPKGLAAVGDATNGTILYIADAGCHVMNWAN